MTDLDAALESALGTHALAESHSPDPWEGVLADEWETLFEAAAGPPFTGSKKDALGRTMYFENGKRVKGPAKPAAEKKPRVAKAAAPAKTPKTPKEKPVAVPKAAAADAPGKPRKGAPTTAQEAAEDKAVNVAFGRDGTDSVGDMRKKLAKILPGDKFDKAILRMADAGWLQVGKDASDDALHAEEAKDPASVIREGNQLFATLQKRKDPPPFEGEGAAPKTAPKAASAKKTAPKPDAPAHPHADIHAHLEGSSPEEVEEVRQFIAAQKAKKAKAAAPAKPKPEKGAVSPKAQEVADKVAELEKFAGSKDSTQEEVEAKVNAMGLHKMGAADLMAVAKALGQHPRASMKKSELVELVRRVPLLRKETDASARS
jgi:hypothetical protein